MSFRQLTQEELEDLAKTTHISSATLIYRLSEASRLNVLNLGQLRDLLKSLKNTFPRERILTSGNKPALIERLLGIAARVLPRKLDNSQLPPAVSNFASGGGGAAPLAASSEVPASKTFDGTGVMEDRFRSLQSPSWSIVEVLGVVPVRYNYHPNAEVKTSIPWSKELCARVPVNSRTTQVHVRLFSMEGKEIQFRPENKLRVNYEYAAAVLAPKPRRNITQPHWSPPGLDVTRMFRSCQAERVPVTFNNAFQLSGVLVATLVEFVAEEALVAVVPMAEREVDSKYERTTASSGDLTELSFTVSLDDPLGLSRIEIPVQSLTCHHFQCFDLATYVSFCVSRCTWNCPVCNRPAPHASLRRMHRFQAVLEQFPDDKLVQCHPDGTYSRHEPDAQSKYERSVTQKRKLMKESQPDVIELTTDRKRPREEEQQQQQEEEEEEEEEVNQQQQQQQQPPPPPVPSPPSEPRKASSIGSMHDPILL